MLPHVATMKGPLQVLLVREVNAIGRHIRCAFSNCGAQKQGKGVQSGRNCARDVPNHSECFWCLYALGSTLFPMQWLHAGIWPPTWAKLAISHQKSCFRIKSSGLHDAQADITYSTCCDMRCTQQRARQSICSGRELSILSTDCTKPSPTMNIIINWTINYISYYSKSSWMFLNVHDLVEELTPLPSLQTQSIEAKPRWAQMSQAYESHMGRCLGRSKSDVAMIPISDTTCVSEPCMIPARV